MGGSTVNDRSSEEKCIKNLDEKLEMDQLLKLFTAFPMEEELLYEALEEHQKVCVPNLEVLTNHLFFLKDLRIKLKLLKNVVRICDSERNWKN